MVALVPGVAPPLAARAWWGRGEGTGSWRMPPGLLLLLSATAATSSNVSSGGGSHWDDEAGDHHLFVSPHSLSRPSLRAAGAQPAG